jgi:PiT family inorganic phosphate transporter
MKNYKMPDWLASMLLSNCCRYFEWWLENCKTMGSKLQSNFFRSVAAETAGALTLYFQEHFKVPVSTTHTI